MLVRRVLIALAVVLVAPSFPRAQQTTGPQPFKPEELEQIVAPIALYPDPLVAQVLMASTYPIEVVQAARFVKANPKLTEAALNEELKKYDWDDSVKSLVSFPQILALMDEKLDWMQKLGDAFLDQKKETMDAIQRLRARAQAEGNLTTNEQQKVIVEPVEIPPGQPAPQVPPGQPAPQQQTVIKIEPANPQVVYVPSYNPTVVYGAWPYPAYPPYYPYPPGYAWGAAAISFGVGMAVGAAVWGGANWGGGDVDIDVNKANNFTNNVNRETRANQIKSERTNRQSAQGGNRQTFQHNPEHRKGAQYRDSGTQQRYNRGSSPQVDSREAFRGRAEQGRQELSRGGADAGRAGGSGVGAGGGANRGGRDAGGGGAGGAQRAGGQGGLGATEGGQRGARDAGSGSAGGAQRGGREPSAFQGMGQGRDQSAYSQRGQSSSNASRASGYSGGGRAGGGAGSAGGGGGGRAGGGGRGGGGGGRGGGRR
jgi:hypothetical protein